MRHTGHCSLIARCRARGQQDFATANHEHPPLRCPNCGRYEIRIDRRSADELKHDAFLNRVGKSFLAWLGVLFLIFLQFGSDDLFDLRVFFVVALLGARPHASRDRPSLSTGVRRQQRRAISGCPVHLSRMWS